MIYLGSRSRLKESFKKEILKEIDDRKPVSTKDLDFAFIGVDGKKYYHFFDHLTIPPERFAVKKETLAWMQLGLDPAEFDNMIDAGESALNEGLKTGKGAAKIGFIFQEMRYRKKMVLHIDLLYYFMAIHYIREDENPEVFDNTIQMEKVEVFRQEVREKGSSFFLTKPELKLLYDLSNMSPQEWTAYWHESLIKAESLKQMLNEMTGQSTAA